MAANQLTKKAGAAQNGSAEAYFEKFAATTVIRVFSFIRSSTFTVERLFWIAVLVIFSSMTAWNVTVTFEKYLSEPTASQIAHILNDSEGLHFDDAAMCLEMNPKSLSKLSENFTDVVITRIVGNHTEDFRKTLREKLDIIYANEEVRRATLMSSVNTLPTFERQISVLGAYHSFEEAKFSVFTPDDIALLRLTTAMLVRLVDLEVDPKPFNVEWQSPAIQRLYEAFVRTGTNFDDLLFLVEQVTCALVQIRIVNTQYNVNTDMTLAFAYSFCKPRTRAMYFGAFRSRYAICYRLDQGFYDGALSFRSVNDAITISVHFEALYKEFASHLVFVWLDLDGKLEIEQRLLHAKANAKQTLDINFETFANALSLRRRPCAKQRERKGSHEECTYWCKLELIVAECDCIPVFRRYVPMFATLPQAPRSCALTLGTNFSTMDPAGRCRTALLDDYSQRNCSLWCERDCETFLITSVVDTVVDRIADAANASTTIRLMMMKLVYERVDEYVTMDSRALVATLGGNLSLYLGASFLALVHIVVFFVRLPFERRSSGAQTSSSAGGNVVGLPSSAYVRGDQSSGNELARDELIADLRDRVAAIEELVKVNRGEMRRNAAEQRAMGNACTTV